MPQVSVIIPSYNHEAFIEECIESVLQQTFQDFEILITDDSSSDGTVQKVEQFTDSRINLFRHSVNQGACVAANNCLAHSQGKYIAMLSSDDVWMPEKLEIQVDYLNSHPEVAAVFGKVLWIDEDSNPITDPNFPYFQVFNVPNRSRHEWLNHFFSYGNCLCHPCSLIRRECYDEVGWLNPTMANLPDFDLWIRLCMKYDIHILDQELIKFRRLMMEANASGDTKASRIRSRYEYFRILDHYLQIENLEDFYLVFPISDPPNAYTKDDIPFLLAQNALNDELEIKHLWGINLLFNQLQNGKQAARIDEIFHYSYIDFIREVASHDIFKIASGHVDRTVYQKFFDAKDSIQELGDVAVQQILPNETEETPLVHVMINDDGCADFQPTGIAQTMRFKLRTLKRRLSLRQDIKLIRESDFFDTTWYLEQNPDVKQSQIEPVRHFLLYGGVEGRDPSEKFSSNWYLATYDDVRRSGMNPLVHYLKFGIPEKRTPTKTT
jgi:glycosyltransferase involved in cell wall biosynthesis